MLLHAFRLLTVLPVTFLFRAGDQASSLACVALYVGASLLGPPTGSSKDAFLGSLADKTLSIAVGGLVGAAEPMLSNGLLIHSVARVAHEASHVAPSSTLSKASMATHAILLYTCAQAPVSWTHRTVIVLHYVVALAFAVRAAVMW
jgi:hypothetical protein